MGTALVQFAGTLLAGWRPDVVEATCWTGTIFLLNVLAIILTCRL